MVSIFDTKKTTTIKCKICTYAGEEQRKFFNALSNSIILQRSKYHSKRDFQRQCFLFRVRPIGFFSLSSKNRIFSLLRQLQAFDKYPTAVSLDYGGNFLPNHITQSIIICALSIHRHRILNNKVNMKNWLFHQCGKRNFIILMSTEAYKYSSYFRFIPFQLKENKNTLLQEYLDGFFQLSQNVYVTGKNAKCII